MTAFWSRRQQLGWAAVIMGSSVLLSRFAGLIRDKVISYYFGASVESDIYFAAFVIPDFINYLLAGAYFSITLIPLLAEAFEADRKEGWRFFSAIVTWVGIASFALTTIAMAFAPALARLAAPGLSPDGWVRLAYFLRIVLPAQMCFLVGTCFTALLYLQKQFLIPAMTPLVYNAMIIAGGLLLRKKGMEGFCWGVLSGAFVGNFLLPYLAARHENRFRLAPVFKHPGLKRFFWLALPLMIGQSIVVLDEQLIRVFGSLAGVGAISRLSYARRIMLVPVGVVAQAAGVASYPFLAELIAKNDRKSFDATLNTAIRNTLVLIVPVSIWLMIISRPTITLIFQQGRFSPSDTAGTAWLLVMFLSVVVCWGYQQIIGRGFYALKDTLTPAVIGTLTTVVSVPIYYVGARLWRAEGVALASALSITLYAIALSLRWNHCFGRAAFFDLAGDLAKVIGLSAAAAVPSLAIYGLLPISAVNSPYIWSLSVISSTGLTFAAVFLGLGKRFCPRLVEPFTAKVFALFARFSRVQSG